MKKIKNIKIIIFYLLTSIFLFFGINISINNFNVGYINNPLTLDPMYVTTSDEFDIIQQLFEGLTILNPNDLSPKPGIAEKWNISIDGLKYTFYLRKNAKWSDGTPINAYTFQYSLFRALNPNNEAPYVYLLFYIKNAKKFYEKKISINQVGINVLNECTLEIILENPTSFFLGLTMLPIFMPIPKNSIEKNGDNWSKIENIVSNGPFIVKDGNLDNNLKIIKNEYYWDKHNVKLDKVNMFFLDTDELAYEMYKSKKLDFVIGLTSSKIPDIIKNPDAVRFPLLATYFYRLNVKNPILADIRVRKALYLSINRNYLCRRILDGGEIPAYGFVPSRMPGYNSYPGERENSLKARELLKEAGYPNGIGFPKLKLIYNNQNEHKIIANEIKKMWKDELNIEIILEELEYSEYRKKIFNLEYDIARSSWVGDYVDPSTFLDIFESEYGKNNRTGWFNLNYTELLYQARKEIEQKKRSALYYEAEKILIDEVPIIPIKNSISIYLLNNSVKGIYPNVMDLHPLREVYYDK